MSSMSSYDKDLVLLGKISSAICNVEMTTTSLRWKEQKARKQHTVSRLSMSAEKHSSSCTRKSSCSSEMYFEQIMIIVYHWEGAGGDRGLRFSHL